MFEAYLKERTVGKKWRPSTVKSNQATLEILVEILGDRPVREIDKAVAREVKEALQSYPANRNKIPRYRGISLAEIATLPDVDSLALKTVNDNLNKSYNRKLCSGVR